MSAAAITTVACQTRRCLIRLRTTILPPQAGGATHFDCENGLGVNIRNLSVNQIELRLDDKTALLNNAVAASGERYVSNNGLFGRGAEWHQKGSEAFFAFTDSYGNKVETTCRSGVIRN